MRALKAVTLIGILVLFMMTGIAMAQQMPNPYGPNVNLATAKKVAAAAAAGRRDPINVVMGVVDTRRQPGLTGEFDVVQWGSVDVRSTRQKLCHVQEAHRPSRTS